jgi:hypothetical protein
MNRKIAKECTQYVVDDAGCGRSLNDDPWAVVREPGTGYRHASVLVGWQLCPNPLFVSVHSYLDVELTDAEATEYATDYLGEIGQFSGVDNQPDYLIR